MAPPSWGAKANVGGAFVRVARRERAVQARAGSWSEKLAPSPSARAAAPPRTTRTPRAARRKPPHESSAGEQQKMPVVKTSVVTHGAREVLLGGLEHIRAQEALTHVQRSGCLCDAVVAVQGR